MTLGFGTGDDGGNSTATVTTQDATPGLVGGFVHATVLKAEMTIALSPREFDVLQVLMQEPGRPFSRTELCERVWQRDHEYDTRTVEIFITRLPHAVEAAAELEELAWLEPGEPHPENLAPLLRDHVLDALAGR